VIFQTTHIPRLFVLKNPDASHRDKTETLRHWRAPFFPALREKKATRYAGGSLLIIISVLLLFFIFGCSKRPAPRSTAGAPKPYKVMGKWYHPISDSKGFRQKGAASWYGKDFHGRKTASGEPYNMYAMTAAHKTLPLGTYVSVRNLKTNKKIEVKVNDRGPFVRGRIIDLSYTAAKKLGIVGPGTAPVEIIALGTPDTSKRGNKGELTYMPGDYYTGNFTIQIGAFTVLENAQRLKVKLDKTYKNVYITRYDNGNELFYRVRVGRCNALEQAERYEAILVQKGFEDAFVIAE